MRTQTLAAAVMIVALGSMGPWAHTASADYHHHHHNSRNRSNSSVPAGTSITVQLDSEISTENIHQGDSWSGTITQAVMAGNQVVIPAGSPVAGVVTTAAEGTHDARPQLGLAVRSVTVNGQSRDMSADTAPIIAGSDRAKKLGAIAGGAAVGALVGHTVARGDHGTLIGGIVGGAAGYGLTRHAMRTLKLKAGTVMAFTMREQMLARR